MEDQHPVVWLLVVRRKEKVYSINTYRDVQLLVASLLDSSSASRAELMLIVPWV